MSAVSASPIEMSIWLHDITVGRAGHAGATASSNGEVGKQLAGVRGDVVAIGPKHLAVLENGEASRTLITLAVTRSR